MKPWRRRDWISAILIGAAIIGYFSMLKVMDMRASDYFMRNRTTNPDLYLEQLRAIHGFSAFLPEYATLKGFDHYTELPPEFLIGRWSMRSAPVRFTAGEHPAQCTDPITFDYGLVLMVEPQSTTRPVDYRIEGGKVDVQIAQGDTFEVTPVSFGASVDHLEFVPPGRTDKVYAYFCGG
jgi:hypothetical protein